MRSRDYDNTQTNLETASSAAVTTQAAYGSVIFGMFTSQNLINALLNGIGPMVLAPISISIALTKASLSLGRLIKSRNRNAGLIGGFLLDLLILMIVGTSAIGSLAFSAVMGALVPFFILATLSINTLYNLGKAGFNLYQWLRTSEPQSRARFKADTIKHAISSLIGLGITIPVALVVVFKIAPVALAITAATVSAAGFTLGLIGTIANHIRSKRAAAQQSVEMETFADTSTHEISEALKTRYSTRKTQLINPDQVEVQAVFKTPKANTTHRWNYNYQKNRIGRAHEKHLDLDTTKDYLLKEGMSKIHYLHEMLRSGSFLDRIQSAKRRAKVTVISDWCALMLSEQERELLLAIAEANLTPEQRAIREAINRLTEAGITTHTQLQTSNHYQNLLKAACQSFFKNVGDTEDFIRSAESYFNAREANERLAQAQAQSLAQAQVLANTVPVELPIDNQALPVHPVASTSAAHSAADTSEPAVQAATMVSETASRSESETLTADASTSEQVDAVAEKTRVLKLALNDQIRLFKAERKARINYRQGQMNSETGSSLSVSPESQSETVLLQPVSVK